jgi:chitin disaccharide deacetylase
LKKLIISGDDFGLHSSINEAIEKGFQEGVLTSASILVNGKKFDEAVRISKRNPKLGIGLHFNIIEGLSIAGEKNVSSIVDEKGLFFDSHNTLAKKIIIGKAKLEEIELELDAQINYCNKSGLSITHIDSHRHLHMLPEVYKLVVKVSNKYGINKFRYLNPPLVDISVSINFKIILSIFFKIIKNRFTKNVITPDYFLGFFNSGNLKYNYIHDVLKKIKSGIIEIGFHPGLDNEILTNTFSTWNNYYDYSFDWEGDFNTIINPKFKEYVEENDIKLESYESLK